MLKEMTTKKALVIYIFVFLIFAIATEYFPITVKVVIYSSAGIVFAYALQIIQFKNKN